MVINSGKIETGGDLTEKEIIRAERNSGVVSNKLMEIQVSFAMLKLLICNSSIFKPFFTRYFFSHVGLQPFSFLKLVKISDAKLPKEKRSERGSGK
jgi:hypothetical protein